MQAAIEAASDVFRKAHPRSFELHQEARKSLPGGNTRTLLHTAPFPVFMKCGKLSELWDEDGNRYHDFVGEMSAGLFGHSNAIIQEAIVSTMQEVGLSLGATNIHEHKYASLLCERFDLELLRFTNSGTEANLHCLAAARRFTGRRKVMVFRGSYHGSVLAFGSGIAPNDVDQNDWILVQYNDPSAVRLAFAEHKDIAAVILEGLQGSGGYIPASKPFLDTIRIESRNAGALMILDEVMTSRLSFGGIKSALGLSPDLVTFGKYLGGGLPFGAFGGREDVLDVYNPTKPGALMHSGTFQNNPLMLSAGYAGMTQVYTAEAVERLNAQGERLRERLQKIFIGSRLCITGRGSLMGVHATKRELKPSEICCRDIVANMEDNDLKTLFWLKMVNAGFWFQQRGSITLNLACGDEAIDLFVAEIQNFFEKYQDLLRPQ